MRCLSAILMNLTLKIAEKSWRHCFPQYNSMGIAFNAQGHVTLKPAVRFFQNSNSIENLLSWLPASMNKIRLKMVERVWDIILLFHSRAHKSRAIGPIPTEFELDQHHYAWPVQRGSGEKWLRKFGDTVFLIITLWEFLSTHKGM